MIDLKNKNIILTGATGIIGGYIIEKLCSVNANVMLSWGVDGKTVSSDIFEIL